MHNFESNKHKDATLETFMQFANICQDYEIDSDSKTATMACTNSSIVT